MYKCDVFRFGCDVMWLTQSCCLQDVLAQYSPEEVVASMVECALKEEEALKRLTAAINLQRDAAELK